MLNVTDTCWFKVRIEHETLTEEEKESVFEVGLFGEVAPKTVANFKGLCQGFETTGPNGEKVFLHYKGSPFHRIVSSFVI